MYLLVDIRMDRVQPGRASVTGQRDHADGLLLLPRCADSWMHEKGRRDRELTGCPPDRWLIHGRLYDLRDFVAVHPGGRDWITWTRGTDCTTEFEAHHLNSERAASILKKYDCGRLASPHPHAAEPFTWAPDGFYMTYKREAFAVLKAAGGWGPTYNMIVICAAAVGLWIAANVAVGLAVGAAATTAAAILAGYATYVLLGVGHNFFHQRDSLWRFVFDLSLFSSADWRLSHAISHHMMPNLDADYETSALEPHVRFVRSSAVNRWPALAVVLHFLLPFVLGPMNVIGRARDCWLGSTKVRVEHAFPLIQLAVFSIARRGFLAALWPWLLLHGVATFCLIYISTPVHRSDFSWSSGCPGGEADFAAHTAISTVDFNSDEENTGGGLWALFVRVFVFGSFNDHITHHLAPTVDLSRQHMLRPVFLRLAKRFGIPYAKRSHPELVLGTLRVLLRRTGDLCYVPLKPESRSD